MCDCLERERWYMCQTCRNRLPGEPHAKAVIWHRRFPSCSAKCWIKWCRGYQGSLVALAVALLAEGRGLLR